LLAQVKLYFNRQILKDEEGRVKTIFIVFTATYVSRAGVYLVKLIIGEYYDSKSEKIINEEFLAISAIAYYVFYNLWDILPLALIMEYHRTCYAEQRRTQQMLENT